MSQEDIATFLSITNADSPDVAKQFLEMAGSNLETAISLYFEHGAAPAATSSTPSGNDVPYIPPEEDNYRAPDQAVHETLVDGHTAYFPGLSFGGVGGRFGPLRSTNHPSGIFNQDEDFGVSHHYNSHDIQEVDSDSDEMDFDDSESDAESQYTDEEYVEIDEDGELIERTRRVKRNTDTSRNRPRNNNTRMQPVSHQDKLALLFRPPFDMIEKLTLDDAKVEARAQQKWIMVNIQAVEVFQCQTLNRDIWREPKVKRLIRPNFVFLQYAYDSPLGQAYINFYSLEKPGTDSLPHIAILDPLTGERLKQWNETPPKLDDFIEEIKEFLQTFSLDPSHTNPVIPTKPAPAKPVEELSEEQQLEYAIAQSMENGLNSKNDTTEFTDKSAVPANTSSKAADKLPVLDEFDLIEPVSNPEPPNTPGVTTRVQFRFGDGSRVVRRFKLDDQVRSLYQYVKAELEGFHDCRFTIATPQRESLIEKLDETLGDAGLKNSSLLIEKE